MTTPQLRNSFGRRECRGCLYPLRAPHLRTGFWTISLRSSYDAVISRPIGPQNREGGMVDPLWVAEE